jgi:NAD dependent epimerase/dehydratase family enzyme
VLPKRLTDAGFVFDYPDLEGALRQILHRTRA